MLFLIHRQFRVEEAIEWQKDQILCFLTAATANNRSPELDPDTRKDLDCLYKEFIVPYQ
jgi:hypothetical protein